MPAPRPSLPSVRAVVRRYLPSEVFLGRLFHLMIREPVRAADGVWGDDTSV